MRDWELWRVEVMAIRDELKSAGESHSIGKRRDLATKLEAFDKLRLSLRLEISGTRSISKTN